MKVLSLNQMENTNAEGRWCDIGVGAALSAGCYFAGVSGLWPCIGAAICIGMITYLVCDYQPEGE